MNRSVAVKNLKGEPGQPNMVWQRLIDNGDGTFSLDVTDADVSASAELILDEVTEINQQLAEIKALLKEYLAQ